MHSTFVLLASAISFLALFDCTAARLSQHEYKKHINALESIGKLEKRQSNGTYAPGQLCVDDDLYQAMQTFSSEAAPFCSSFLSIGNYTSTTAYTTTHT